MPLTSTDDLSTPASMVELLRDLTTIMEDVGALPDAAQQRFWEETDRALRMIPAEELQLTGTLSKYTVSVFYGILVNMCGSQLTEMVNGEAKEYYERVITQMKEVTQRSWETFLDEKLAATADGFLAVAEVSIDSAGYLGSGVLRYVDGASKILKLTTSDGRERYFSSRDIVVMEFEKAPATPQ
jgi:hypothetical protein